MAKRMTTAMFGIPRLQHCSSGGGLHRTIGQVVSPLFTTARVPQAVWCREKRTARPILFGYFRAKAYGKKTSP